MKFCKKPIFVFIVLSNDCIIAISNVRNFVKTNLRNFEIISSLDFCEKHEKVKTPNEKLTAHCARKYTINLLAEMSGMEPHKIAFRVGMTTQNVHTFFDYVFNNSNFDKETGKKISGWSHAFDGKLFGGYPASLDDIKTDRSMIKPFLRCIFGHHDNLDDDIKEMLFASVLRFYKELVTFVRNEPLGECKM